MPSRAYTVSWKLPAYKKRIILEISGGQLGRRDNLYIIPGSAPFRDRFQWQDLGVA